MCFIKNVIGIICTHNNLKVSSIFVHQIQTLCGLVFSYLAKSYENYFKSIYAYMAPNHVYVYQEVVEQKTMNKNPLILRRLHQLKMR